MLIKLAVGMKFCNVEIPNDNTQTETGVPFKGNSRSSQMVHIVSHSFCDFLGTLPGAESRCNRTKTTQDSEGSQRVISDNFMSENQNGNTKNDFLIHDTQLNKNTELSKGEMLTKDNNDKSLLSQNYQHNQNKVTVFVPYSTIVRCMNETMDRKRKNKKIFQSDVENEHTLCDTIVPKKDNVTDQLEKAAHLQCESDQMSDNIFESCNAHQREIILINDDIVDNRQEELSASDIDSVTKEKDKNYLPIHSTGRASCVVLSVNVSSCILFVLSKLSICIP